MTYREYLNNCTDELEKAIIAVNLARSCPNYDSLSRSAKKQKLNELLDKEMSNTKKNTYERE